MAKQAKVVVMALAMVAGGAVADDLCFDERDTSIDACADCYTNFGETVQCVDVDGREPGE